MFFLYFFDYYTILYCFFRLLFAISNIFYSYLDIFYCGFKYFNIKNFIFMDFSLNNYQFSPGEHRDKNVIWVKFENDLKLRTELKQKFHFVKFSWTKLCWYLPDTDAIREQVGINKKIEINKDLILKINEINRPAIQQMLDTLILKSYSENTIKTYCGEFAQLLIILKKVDVNTLTPERLRAYFLYCIKELNLSENLIHSRINAVKFYFEQVLHRDVMLFEDIPRPKKKYLLPKVFSKEDILKLFQAIDNPKHLLIIKLCYGMGLRVSEIVNLKINDIDFNRMMVLIESSKGKKDRYVNLPTSIVEELKDYLSVFKPEKFVFEGQYGGQYSIRSVQAVFKTAMKKAKINKDVGIHALRHSYATHLLEVGTDMVFIQKLLGHKDVKTTQIYAKVSQKQLSKVKSPLDDL